MATISAEQSGNVVDLGAPQSAKAESLLRMTIRRFFKHRMAVIGLLMLAGVVLYVTVGAVFYSEEYANDTSPLERWGEPTAERPFGSDNAGRDVLARTIWGGQISLLIGVTSVTIAITLGTVVGLVAGYFGGWVDSLLMRIVEALLAIPTLVLLLVLSRTLIDTAGGSTVNFLGRELGISIVAVILIIGFTSWMGLSRIVRSMVLSIKEQEFVSAARALGAGDMRIIFMHILPNCLAPIIVAATLGVGTAIIIEAALSFLGFGVQPPDASWGNIINLARNDIEDYWWLWVFPGTFIVLTVLSINFIGDGLRDALDPRSLK
jgi:peptide/nickel transport system permease protein